MLQANLIVFSEVWTSANVQLPTSFFSLWRSPWSPLLPAVLYTGCVGCEVTFFRCVATTEVQRKISSLPTHLRSMEQGKYAVQLPGPLSSSPAVRGSAVDEEHAHEAAEM
jgi:hypothetical protein